MSLDALIAEKVMGVAPMDVRVRGEVDTPPVRIWNASPYWRQDGRHDRYQLTMHADAPCYSTNIAVAWLVVEKMHGYYLGLSRQEDGKWLAVFANESCLGDDEADAAPLAICRAALAAVAATPEHPERAPAPELIRGEAPPSRSYPDGAAALTPTLAAPTGAAAPTEEVCVCGHPRSGHTDTLAGRCVTMRPWVPGRDRVCECERFRAASPAGRAPARAGATPELETELDRAARKALNKLTRSPADFAPAEKIASALAELLSLRAEVSRLSEPPSVGYPSLERLASAPFDGDGMHYFTANDARALRSLLTRVSRLSARPAAQQTKQD